MGGSFTISNLGMFPVDHFSAILNPPQGAIMAVGRGVDRAVLGGDGQPTESPVVTVTVSADARMADEADIGRFLEVGPDRH
jgi:pyruvate dehydrogenase E2 component (dihydrolipoamide acetyltransferase)